MFYDDVQISKHSNITWLRWDQQTTFNSFTGQHFMGLSKNFQVFSAFISNIVVSISQITPQISAPQWASNDGSFQEFTALFLLSRALQLGTWRHSYNDNRTVGGIQLDSMCGVKTVPDKTVPTKRPWKVVNSNWQESMTTSRSTKGPKILWYNFYSSLCHNQDATG